MKNKDRSEITKNRIIQAATRCFAEQGYNAAGVSEICKVAGVSKGAFYHHFPSKNALFLALLTYWLDDLDLSLAAIVESSSSFSEMLVTMGGMMEDIFEVYVDQIPILFEFWMQAGRDKEIWQAAVAPMEHYQHYFADLIQKGIDAGNLEPVNPNYAAHTVISFAVGLLLQGMLIPHSKDWPGITRQSIDILLDGIKRRDG